MGYAVRQEDFVSLKSCWADLQHDIRRKLIFTLPGWLEIWWQAFGAGADLCLLTVKREERIIGIAPLMIREAIVSFIGSSDVCDYLDFIIAPEMERDFFETLLQYLRQRHIRCLNLKSLRPDSTVLRNLVSVAENMGHMVVSNQEDVSVNLDLPDTWNKYLAMLNAKQRHEVKRKLSRLAEAGNIDYYSVTDKAAINDYMDTFLKMFSESRKDKAAFLTPRMESFFRSMANAMSDIKLLKLGVLQLDAVPVAMTMCFDYDGCLCLYNSSYDPQYASLSVGLLCKVLCIKAGIEEGKKSFDFLKGGEAYKYRLGGRELSIYNSQIAIA